MYLAACLVGVEGSQMSSHYKWRKCTILWLHLIPSFSVHTSCTMQIRICYPLTSFFPSLYLKNFSWLFAILKYSFYLWSTALASIKSGNPHWISLSHIFHHVTYPALYYINQQTHFKSMVLVQAKTLQHIHALTH